MNRNCRRKTEKAFPRPCGGDPDDAYYEKLAMDFSPPMRG